MTLRAAGPVTVIRAFGVLAAILDEAVKDRRLLTIRGRAPSMNAGIKTLLGALSPVGARARLSACAS